ncbi:hypothetical protein NPIL_506011 [Nephila pilipes]|uniref:Uncharacterized protein n=1 Tax=Nephila pilipes TaxID=299642 RepID=A0A8X6PBB2_NEPPI|nr:hypothetical protein NPIL_506011 [Nephila pilipes]
MFYLNVITAIHLKESSIGVRERYFCIEENCYLLLNDLVKLVLYDTVNVSFVVFTSSVVVDDQNVLSLPEIDTSFSHFTITLSPGHWGDGKKNCCRMCSDRCQDFLSGF